MSDVQKLNYTTHAIEDLTREAKQLPQKFRHTTKNLQRITQLMDQAVKFLLPERGELLDLERFDASTLGLMRLPYPLVVLEAPWPSDVGLVEEGLFKESASTRRIVLAWDHTFAAQSKLGRDFKEPGLYVVSVYYADENREWMAAPMGVFVPLDNEIRTLANQERQGVDGLMAQVLLDQKAVTSKSPVLDAHYFELLPELMELLAEHIGPEPAMARMQMDVRDEVLCLHTFCLTVNCVNIGVATLPAEAKLNAKRIRNGKPPLYEYKVLELPEPRVVPSRPGQPLEGSRNAPRTHLRRGHPRRLADGRLTFVRAAVIGAGNLGVVHKDYRIAPRGS